MKRCNSGKMQLAFRASKSHILTMAKSTKLKRTHEMVGGHEVVGTLSDGVAVLKPKSKPSHFTSRQIRSTIASVMRDRLSTTTGAGQ